MAKKKKRVTKKGKKKTKNEVQPRKRKRLRIRYGRIFIALFLLGLCVYFFFSMFGFRIKNIYISGNAYLSDQEIIEIAQIQNYPSTFSALCFKTKQKLESHIMIEKASVTKKGLFEIHIRVTENKPLFYHKTLKQTVFTTGETLEKAYLAPILINYVPDKIYKRFISKMKLVDIEILNRISEIEYKPNDVDKNRFLLTMKDGNYVYLTLGRFDNINNYVEIIRKFEHKKGILYLDSGEYFKVMEG